MSKWTNPTLRRPVWVRAPKACRGLRAWRVLKETHRTKEAREVPAALTTRAKQEGRRNDKECLLTLRASDWLIVASRKVQAPKLVKRPTAWRSPYRHQCRTIDGVPLANLPVGEDDVPG